VHRPLLSMMDLLLAMEDLLLGVKGLPLAVMRLVPLWVCARNSKRAIIPLQRAIAALEVSVRMTRRGVVALLVTPRNSWRAVIPLQRATIALLVM